MITSTEEMDVKENDSSNDDSSKHSGMCEYSSDEESYGSDEETLKKFGGCEHKEIGNRAFKDFIEGTFIEAQITEALKTGNHDLIVALNKLKEVLEVLNSDFVNFGLYEPLTCTLTLSNTDYEYPNRHNKLKLEAGEWVALGGDFYGVANRPIANIYDEGMRRRENRDLKEKCIAFNGAYEELAGIVKLSQSEQDKKLLSAAEKKRAMIKVEIEKEEKVVCKARQRKKSIQDMLEIEAAKGDQKYAEAMTQYPYITKYLPLGFLFSDYVELAKMNFDHFGEQAKEAYEAGHTVALETAVLARNYTHENKQIEKKHQLQMLIKAFTQELFACHFLTDLFASGHMRTPRLELVEFLHTFSLPNQWLDDNVSIALIAGILAMNMHDEDNDVGLRVTSEKYKDHPNIKEREWLARGDHCFYEENAEKNQSRMQETVVAALLSIYAAYNPEVPGFDYNFRNYIPQPINEHNHPALFHAVRAKNQEGKEYSIVERREKLSLQPNETCGHITNWSPTLLFFRTKPLDYVKGQIRNRVAGVQESAEDAKEVVGKLTQEMKQLIVNTTERVGEAVYVMAAGDCGLF